MSLPRYHVCARWLARSFALLGLLLLLYVLSSGPAMRWVVSAIAGQSATLENVARYDARLGQFIRFYEPLFRFRQMLLAREWSWFERVYWRWENLFYPPARIADGRRLHTAPRAPDAPGPAGVDYYRQIIGDPEVTLPPQMEVHFLKSMRRILVVMPSEEWSAARTTMIYSSVEHPLDPYVLLLLP